ncbi:histidine phosphatase family protein [Leptothermofonsia sp. ETS-13]|uniref:histidine phosphatase family protein n=1 Tax=Leptothermofonsia sp. ETS-13 TaxID=3035696 RepID=UPI003BA35D0E
MNQIWIIRHGQSLSNAGLSTTGPDDNVLTKLGVAQAVYAAIAVKQPPNLVVTSPYIRTQLTARPLLEKYSSTPVETWSVQEFTYLSLSLQRTTREERIPLSVAYWQRCDPHYVDGEQAESFVSLMNRAQETLHRLRQAQGFVVVFSHSTFMKALLWQILATPHAFNASAMRHFHWFHMGFRVPNAAILKLEFGKQASVRWSNLQTSHIPEHLQTPKPERAIEIALADQPS